MKRFSSREVYEKEFMSVQGSRAMTAPAVPPFVIKFRGIVSLMLSHAGAYQSSLYGPNSIGLRHWRSPCVTLNTPFMSIDLRMSQRLCSQKAPEAYHDHYI
jgi:hypothetical protein